jgi:hypothetical protein
MAMSMMISHQRCPACGTSKTKIATRKTFIDHALSRLTIYPFRCQLCAARFRALVGRSISNPRRSFERVQVTFPVWFKLRQSAPSDMGKEGVIENLSMRGCRIRSSTPLPADMRVELEFQHSDCSFPITIDEAVVRSTGEGRIGLRFVQLGRQDERRLRQIIDLWLPANPRPVLEP